MPKEKTSSILAGISGEYFVAGELSRRGWIASLTLRNTRSRHPREHEGTNRSVGVQVKTSSGRNPKWILNKKAETMTDPTVFYAFVRLMNGDTPRFTLCRVPSLRSTPSGRIANGLVRRARAASHTRTV